ncbi:uncharacterized protein LOC131148318 [Malania oleifera]|uniref:uncharacterized protein LOC131148318 n=1 Tax=Malania oleifera TaxID=397392 RepID=UPI0025ADE818|nr:uncharacterized protein LOC131148318 [Malania oleifera]
MPISAPTLPSKVAKTRTVSPPAAAPHPKKMRTTTIDPSTSAAEATSETAPPAAATPPASVIVIIEVESSSESAVEAPTEDIPSSLDATMSKTQSLTRSIEVPSTAELAVEPSDTSALVQLDPSLTMALVLPMDVLWSLTPLEVRPPPTPVLPILCHFLVKFSSSLAIREAATSVVPPPSVPSRASTPLEAPISRPPAHVLAPTQAPTAYLPPPTLASPKSPAVSGSFSEEEEAALSPHSNATR